jgi:predicted CopG family antitoxin
MNEETGNPPFYDTLQRMKKENDELRNVISKIYKINKHEIDEYGECDHSEEIDKLCMSVRFTNQ